MYYSYTNLLAPLAAKLGWLVVVTELNHFVVVAMVWPLHFVIII
jgi:hypothetical protein